MRLIKVVKAHCAPLSARALTTAVKAQMSQIFCIFVLCSELLSSIRVHLLVEFLITKKPAGSNLVFWIVSWINWFKKDSFMPAKLLRITVLSRYFFAINLRIKECKMFVNLSSSNFWSFKIFKWSLAWVNMNM